MIPPPPHTQRLLVLAKWHPRLFIFCFPYAYVEIYAHMCLCVYTGRTVCEFLSLSLSLSLSHTHTHTHTHHCNLKFLKSLWQDGERLFKRPYRHKLSAISLAKVSQWRLWTVQVLCRLCQSTHILFPSPVHHCIMRGKGWSRCSLVCLPASLWPYLMGGRYKQELQEGAFLTAAEFQLGWHLSLPLCLSHSGVSSTYSMAGSFTLSTAVPSDQVSSVLAPRVHWVSQSSGKKEPHFLPWCLQPRNECGLLGWELLSSPHCFPFCFSIPPLPEQPVLRRASELNCSSFFW